MIEAALRLSAPDLEKAPFSARMLALFAPPPQDLALEFRAATDRWRRVDRAASVVSVLLFARPDEQRRDIEDLAIERFEWGLESYPGDGLLPDEALASCLAPLGRMSIAGGPRWLPQARWPNEVRRRLLAALTSAHQVYYGPLEAAWRALAFTASDEGASDRLAEALFQALERTDRRGDLRNPAKDAASVVPQANDIARAIRLLGEFYDRAVVARPTAKGDAFLQALLRLRFSRTLTAVETLWDIMLEHSGPDRTREAPAAPPIGPQWEMGLRGQWRLKRHDLDAEVGRLLELGELRRYDRIMRPAAEGLAPA